MGHGGEFWQNVVHWRREWQTTSVFLPWEPHEQYEKAKRKDRTLKDELPRLVGAQYATGDQWRNNPRKNEETESKQKQHPVVDVTGDVSKVQYCWQGNMLKSKDKTYFGLNERTRTKNKTLFFVLFFFLIEKCMGSEDHI